MLSKAELVTQSGLDCGKWGREDWMQDSSLESILVAQLRNYSCMNEQVLKMERSGWI